MMPIYESAIEHNKGNDVYFITGATGLMASEFVAEVLHNNKNAECILLLRAENINKAEAKLNSLLGYLFPDPDEFLKIRHRVSLVLGDVSKLKLGMSKNDWDKVVSSTNYILHSAALTDWGAPIEDATNVNIDGVKEMIDLAYACRKNLRKFLHISSAYVSGSKTGLISPDELDMSVNSCDNYQLTKRAGEKLIRRAWATLPITIVRPGAVVGNAHNGRTLTYKTFYYPLQLLYNGLPLVLPVAKSGHLEAVPSDWAAKVMLEMMKDTSTNRRCFHLTSGNDVLTNQQIKTVVYSTFESMGEKLKNTLYVPYFIYKLFISPLIKHKIPNGNGLDQKIKLYRHYMTYKRVFDNSSTLEFIKDKNISLPIFENYLPLLMQYAIKDKWHKKRTVLQKLKQRAQKSNNKSLQMKSNQLSHDQ